MTKFPKRLYKYRAGKYGNNNENRDLKALKGNEIWLSRPDKFDDIFDCRLAIKIFGTVDEDLSNRLRNHTYISCFSETSESFIMWYYYANGHKGYCIEYDFQGLSDMIYSKKSGSLMPVHYNNTFNNINVNPTFATLIKSEEWAFENEWRIIHPDISDEEYVNIIGPKPQKVYAGCLLKETDTLYKELKQYCRENEVQFIHRRVSDTYYLFDR